MKPATALRIRDGLLMVAVTAVGLSWAHESWEAIQVHEGTFSDWSYRHAEPACRSFMRTPWLGQTSVYFSSRALIASVVYVGAAVASSWGIALVVVDRMRRPRSRIWRARRPGAVACLAVTTVLILTLFGQVIRPHTRFSRITVGVRAEVRRISSSWGEFWTGDARFGPDPLVNAVAVMPRMAGFVIAGAWVALALAGAWKPEPSWVDRAGRLIGVYWLVAAAHFLVFPL